MTARISIVFEIIRSVREAVLSRMERMLVKVLALYLPRYGTVKRANGDATSAVCRLRYDVSEALYAIPTSLYHTKSVYATQ